MKRVLHTFDSRREALAELTRMSMKKPHARALHSVLRLIDGGTEHIFVDVSGDGLHRVKGLEIHEHVPHCPLSIVQDEVIRARIRS